MNTNSFCEYIWLNGTRPTQRIRSKARVVALLENPVPADFPA